MTEQIVIKLNKKKFKPLLDECVFASGGAINNPSECVGKVLFFIHTYLTEKNDKKVTEGHIQEGFEVALLKWKHIDS